MDICRGETSNLVGSWLEASEGASSFVGVMECWSTGVMQ
jgi:hypothetical protein